jgi:hypothetical protein
LLLPIIAYTLSSTKLDLRAKWFLLGSNRLGVGEEGSCGNRGDGGKGREMTQTLYAHINKRKKKDLHLECIKIIIIQ